MTLAEILRSLTRRGKSDLDVERLEQAAAAGRAGANLAEMSDEEVIRRLSRR